MQTLKRRVRTVIMDLIREEWVDISTPEGQTLLSEKLADTILDTCFSEPKEPHKPDLLDGELKYNLKPTSIREAVKQYFRFNVNWNTKTAREWMEWATAENITPDQLRHAAEVWRADKKFNWQSVSLRLLFQKWPELMETQVANVSFISRPSTHTDEDGIPLV